MAVPAVIYMGREVEDPQGQHSKYIELLTAHHDVRQVNIPAAISVLPPDGVNLLVPTNYEYYPATSLICWVPTEFPWGAGLSKQASAEVWQYKLNMKPHAGQAVSAKKPKAYRIGFLLDPRFSDDEHFTVSHLCHNNFCHNPAHLVLEDLAVNKSRNGCPGGAFCQHQTRCLRPGPFFQG